MVSALPSQAEVAMQAEAKRKAEAPRQPPLAKTQGEAEVTVSVLGVVLFTVFHGYFDDRGSTALRRSALDFGFGGQQSRSKGNHEFRGGCHFEGGRRLSIWGCWIVELDGSLHRPGGNPGAKR